MYFARTMLLLLIVVAVSGCKETLDDLLPSGEDRRPDIEQGIPGTGVGQIAPDFTLSDTLGNPVTLTDELAGSGGVVLYFTMWCPICDSHMSHMRSQVIPYYPGIKFLFIDYVSGSVANSRSAQISNGYTGSEYMVLVDTVQSVLNAYNGTMGTAVVIDNNGVVQMNEDYKDGTKMIRVLDSLP